MKLVVGLGNPEATYRLTRHNVGFMVLDAMVGQDNWTVNKKWKAAVSSQKLVVSNQGVLYMKPLTYMNNSGEAVRAVMNYYHITVPELVVIFDDKDLPFGTTRFRSKGSSGGHNGIKSIIAHVGSEDFARFKVGIAPTNPEHVMGDTADYVLAKFSKEELKQLPEIIDQVVNKVKDWL
ncbi:MAG: aminoacyl-tRNA hydrolase [Candidatus Kerfeldbacteria bacterium]|nr:aminoacyl-tRNA hydrolase [Candidatus Kerfeldbacteria bacterium]